MKWLVQAYAIAAAASAASAQNLAPYTNSTGGNGSLAHSAPYYPSPWMDGSGDWDRAYKKAQAFVKQLTLIEKVNLTTGVGWEGERCVGNTGSIPRLAFRALCLQDSPTAVRGTDFNSVFPAGGTVAAAWDRDLWYLRGRQMGLEFRGKGIDVQLGPVVGPLGRSPEGGRGWEGFSPDPYLSGVAVAQTVKGIQDVGIMACTKHYILNEQEHFRQAPEARSWGFNITESISSNIDDKTMHELYLWPFADAVRAGTAAIMCSYNQINNSYGCQNSYTLNHLLKGELGFQGFVMSDWQAQHSGVGSALAGMDMSMPGDVLFDTDTTFWGTNLTLAVVNGTVPEWRIDDMATRIMSAFYYVGRDRTQTDINFDAWTTDTYGFRNFYASQNYEQINSHVDVRGDHNRAIREAAARSTVLLKNNGALPLTGKEKYVSTFGSDAGGNQYGPNGCPNRDCDNGTLAIGYGSGVGEFPYLITPAEAIGAAVIQHGGLFYSITDDYAYTETGALARNTAMNNGVCMVFVNTDSGEGFIDIDDNIGDRKNLTLWHNGEDLIANVTGNCNNTVLVIHSVGPVIMTSYYNNPNITAILWASLPGEESGNSLTDVLYGRVNPGGKLPFTLGAARSDYTTDVLYEPNNGPFAAPQDDFTEGVFIDYRGFDKNNVTPIYEFGFGLSYTNFSYSNINVQRRNVSGYVPTTGRTQAAPILGNFSTNLADYLFPSSFRHIPYYIYAYLNSTDARTSYNWTDFGAPASTYIPMGAQDGSPQPRLPAGGAPGGNPQLYDVLFTVTATITNTGKVAGEEIPQLYVSLGGPDDPKVVLRGFERLSIQPGGSTTFTADLTRRDVSSWDTGAQNWVITNYPKTVYVGSSSRKLPLSAKLSF